MVDFLDDPAVDGLLLFVAELPDEVVVVGGLRHATLVVGEVGRGGENLVDAKRVDSLVKASGGEVPVQQGAGGGVEAWGGGGQRVAVDWGWS